MTASLNQLDEFVSKAVGDALAELQEAGLDGGSIRERKHFDPTIKRVIGGLTDGEVFGKQLETEDFKGIGAVDVVIPEMAALIELKWSYDESRSKIYESAWDAIKLALLCGQLQPLSGAKPQACVGYLVAGASVEAWVASECSDLFSTGTVDPREMWKRPLVPSGSNAGETVGEDLILGSPSASSPSASPEGIEVVLVEAFPVRPNYVVRVVRVQGSGAVAPW